MYSCGQRINSPKQRGKADAVQPAEGSSPKTRYGKVFRTPPGSESGACIYGGSSGTWESHLSPINKPEMRVHRLNKVPGADGPHSRQYQRAERNTQPKRSGLGYRGTTVKNEGPRDGQMAVLAEHSTEGQERVVTRATPQLTGKVGNRGPRDPL